MISGFLFVGSFQLRGTNVIVSYMLVLDLAGDFVPETLPHPLFAELALGLESVGQNLGMFCGPPWEPPLRTPPSWAGTGPPGSSRY